MAKRRTRRERRERRNAAIDDKKISSRMSAKIIFLLLITQGKGLILMDVIQIENDKKRKYLRKYRKHERNIRRIESEIEEIRSMKLYPSMNNDGMPHGVNQKDLSNYAAELLTKENELYHEGVEQVKAYKDITYRINQMEDENERDVLYYYYIKAKNWWEIADLLGYTERHVKRIHGNALRNFKLPEDVMECHT